MKLESELKHNGVHEANIKSSRKVRGQMLEAESEAEDKILVSRTAWPRGLNITGYMRCILPPAVTPCGSRSTGHVLVISSEETSTYQLGTRRP